MLTTLSNIPGWLVPALITAFIIVCVVMMLVILIQKPKGGGLSGAFGGAGGGGGSEMAAFGAKTGDVLTWFTVVLFLCFLFLAMGLTWAIRAEVRPEQAAAEQPGGAQQIVDDEIVEQLTEGAGGAAQENGAAEPAPELVDEPADLTMPADESDDAPAEDQ